LFEKLFELLFFLPVNMFHFNSLQKPLRPVYEPFCLAIRRLFKDFLRVYQPCFLCSIVAASDKIYM